ncbi:OmpA/MotB domain protein [Alkaliphilus metalliredigens QYMF]|uniref:OmpA/MotB domain protein n=1 Tax=Alkaliphilus metalliredigens (strain QYMF) TaxID=293826 RepID=A6TRP7_ALKMQ|nr:flagellar motor protein MotB [Alkaliphilus metalliredigens]ABR48865.1 OmpA/MotB domain protein [Alkaliphilus metalliredigens QYMF]
MRKEGSTGSPAWMATYADMVTLLLCFFILLFTFSEIDAKKFQAVMQSFQGSLGVLDSGKTIEDSDYITEAMLEELTTNEQVEWEDFRKLQEIVENYLDENGLASDILVLLESRGLILRFHDNILFDSGRAELKSRPMEILKDLAGFLDGEEFQNKHIRVEGHTDTDPLRVTSKYETNWELSVARASNVVRFLIEDAGVTPERFSAAGYGEYRPLAANDTIENKAINRRVDVVILRSELLDFRP